MRAISLFFIILLVAFAPAFAELSTAELAAANRLLEAELPLAKKAQIYFLFDLSGPEIRFRANGLTVARLPVVHWRLWGPRPIEQPLVMSDKEALFEPEREQIRILPAGQAPEISSASDLQALELGDMPSRYWLILSANTRIRVVAAPDGFWAHGLDGLKTLCWYLSRPLISDWQMLRGKTYTEVQIALRPEDARLLYWSLTPGAGCLIQWPAG